MAICPFARWRPLPENATARRIVPKRHILHTAVDGPGRTDLHRFFARSDIKVESTFYVYLDGTLDQYMDTERQADANFHANPDSVSTETEDDGRPNQLEWTPQQMATLVRLQRWLNGHHGIPNRRCASPTGAGVGYHSMWGSPSSWTPAAGKTCPGVKRIAQVEAVIRGAALGVTPEAVSLGDRVLKLTDPFMRGGDVEALQAALTASGFPVAKDGVFGPATDEAVKALQRKHGLADDGDVGPLTLALFANRDLWVIGAIRDKWVTVRDLVGEPLTQELPCPDGRGRYNHFERGSIYWTPEGGAHVVRGEIRAAWERLGWERSEFGYPRGDEAPVEHPDGWQVRQDFERGIMFWKPGIAWSYREVWRA